MFQFTKFDGKLRQTYVTICQHPGSMMTELNNAIGFNCAYYIYALENLGAIRVEKSIGNKPNGWICKRVYPEGRIL